MRKRSREIFEQSYSIDHMVQNYQRLYEELL